MTNEQQDEQKPNNDKTVSIIVNGREREFAGNEISFEQVVALANLGSEGVNIVFTVTYKRGEGHKPEGSLVAGESVKVKQGMIFNVTRTDKS